MYQQQHNLEEVHQLNFLFHLVCNPKLQFPKFVTRQHIKFFTYIISQKLFQSMQNKRQNICKQPNYN